MPQAFLSKLHVQRPFRRINKATQQVMLHHSQPQLSQRRWWLVHKGGGEGRVEVVGARVVGHYPGLGAAFSAGTGQNLLACTTRPFRPKEGNGTTVADHAAIVRSREDRHQPPVVLQLVASQRIWWSVRTDAKCEASLVQEALCDVRAEGHRRPASLRGQGAEAVVWICPLRVEDDLLLLGPLQVPLRVWIAPPPSRGRHRPEPREACGGRPEEAAMHDKDLLANNCEEGEHHEESSKILLDSGAVLLQALLVETTPHSEGPCIHLCVLMIASKDMHGVREAELERSEKQEDLACIRPSIGNVAVEDIHNRVRGRTVGLENVQHIQQLTVGVTNNDDLRILTCDWHGNIYDRGFQAFEKCLQRRYELSGSSSGHRNLLRSCHQPFQELQRTRQAA
mmetsp:Transcript_16976/g.43347  ORF Transcript_16976/g.43347 Transcript_16976/m.43347 type:complete len:395 (-) Transcript_16976:273-1457(-)